MAIWLRKKWRYPRTANLSQLPITTGARLTTNAQIAIGREHSLMSQGLGIDDAQAA